MAQIQEEVNGRAKFDVYARPFVPQNLRAVNEAPAYIVQSLPVRWIDFDAYFHSFAGTNFIHAEADRTRASLQNTGAGLDPHGRFVTNDTFVGTNEIVKGSSTKQFSPHCYQKSFAQALRDDCEALHREYEDHGLYRVPLIKAAAHMDPRENMFR